ncbi:MAG: acylphosphatase [Pseudomonadota bacterium]
MPAEDAESFDYWVATRVRIEGRVQGVGYRYWAEGWARRLGLLGYVRNLTDGAVDAVFAGPAQTVARMRMLCAEGPPAADVAAVTPAPAPETWSVDVLKRAAEHEAARFLRAPNAAPDAPPPAPR